MKKLWTKIITVQLTSATFENLFELEHFHLNKHIRNWSMGITKLLKNVSDNLGRSKSTNRQDDKKVPVNGKYILGFFKDEFNILVFKRDPVIMWNNVLPE